MQAAQILQLSGAITIRDQAAHLIALPQPATARIGLQHCQAFVPINVGELLIMISP